MNHLPFPKSRRLFLLLACVVLCATFGEILAQEIAAPTDDPVTTELPDYGSALTRMLIVLAIMVGGLLVLAKFLPRWLNARGLPGRGASHIQVIDRVQLEPRRSLYLVKLGGQLFFLGSSETGVQLLREQPIDAEAFEGLDAEDLPELTQPRDAPGSTPTPTAEGFDGLLASKRT